MKNIITYNLCLYKNDVFINRINIYKKNIIISSNLNGDIVVHGLKNKIAALFEEKIIKLSLFDQGEEKKIKYGNQFNIDDYSFRFNKATTYDYEVKKINYKYIDKVSSYINKKWYANIYIMTAVIAVLFIAVFINPGESNHTAYADVFESNTDDVTLQQSLEILGNVYSDRLYVKFDNNQVILKGFIETKEKLSELLLELRTNLKINHINFDQVFTLADIDRMLLVKMNLFGISEKAYFQFKNDKFYLAGNFVGNESKIIDEILMLIKYNFNINEIVKTHIDNQAAVLQGLHVKAVWTGENPYLKLNNGVKYHLGSRLPSSWVLSDINNNLLIFNDNTGNKLSIKIGA